jgi:hypothetical protein
MCAYKRMWAGGLRANRRKRRKRFLQHLQENGSCGHAEGEHVDHLTPYQRPIGLCIDARDCRSPHIVCRNSASLRTRKHRPPYSVRRYHNDTLDYPPPFPSSSPAFPLVLEKLDILRSFDCALKCANNLPSFDSDLMFLSDTCRTVHWRPTGFDYCRL